MKLRWGRYLLAIMAGIVAVVGFIWLWWKGVPSLYEDSGAGPDARIRSVTGIRIGLLIGLAGAGVVGVLWLNVRTVEVLRSGRFIDRYFKAVAQLGSGKIELRLGAVYALELLAVEAPRGRYPASIVELLGVYTRVRSDSPCRTKNGYLSSVKSNSSQEGAAAEAMLHAERRRRPSADVQAAITVLGRLGDKVSSRGDLSGAYLCGAVLTRAKFTRGIFTGACLANADLTNADLTGADLGDADITHAVLAGADLAGANLIGADLTGADLVGADLTGADLAGAILVDAILINTKLVGADLNSADLPNAYLNEADLTGADLTGANLTGADLTGARLDRATLDRACLNEAILRGAEFTATDLSAADLAGADLAKAVTLTQQQINRAAGNAQTLLPDGLARPAHWS